MKRRFELRIDLDMLNQQIKDLLESNCREASKSMIHNLLGEIKDQYEDQMEVA